MRLVIAVLAGVVALLPGGAPARSAAPVPGPVPGPVPVPVPVLAYALPVPGAVVRRFDPPAGPYGPGHRGVDLAAPPGASVRAAAAGVVTFAGPVAGRGVVVVQHADGIRTEYEPLTVTVTRGSTVAGGARLGVVSGRHAACAPGSCLHWSARRGEQYLDPMLLLRPLGPVRLLPWR